MVNENTDYQPLSINEDTTMEDDYERGNFF